MTEDDAREAEEVLRFALFKEVLKRKRVAKRKKRRLNAGGATAPGAGESEDESEEGSSEEEEPAARMSMPPQQAVAKRAKELDGAQWQQDSQDIAMDADAPNVRVPPTGMAEDGGVREERYVLNALRRGHASSTAFAIGYGSSAPVLRRFSQRNGKTMTRSS